MNVLKKGISDTFIYGIGIVIVKSLSFLLLPFYTRMFSPQQYALIVLVLTVMPLTRTVISLEVNQASVVYASDHPCDKADYISTGFWFAFLVNIVLYSLLVFVLKCFFKNMIPFTLLSLTIIAGALLFDSLFYYVLNVARWEGLSGKYNFSMVLSALVELVSVFLLVGYFKSVIGVFSAWLIARSMGFILCLSFTRKLYCFQIKKDILKKMLKFSVPLAMNNVPANINATIDRFLISGILGIAMLGYYGVAFTFASVVSVLMTSLASALSPMIYKLSNKSESKEIATLFYLFFTLACLLPIGFYFFNHEIISLMTSGVYTEFFNNNKMLIPVLMFYPIFSGLYVFFPGFFVKKKSWPVVFISLFSLCLNVLLIWVLASKWELRGVVFSIVITSIITSMIYGFWSMKYFHINVQFGKMVVLIFLCAFSFALSSFVMTINVNELFLFFIKVMGFVLCGSLFAMAVFGGECIRFFRDIIKSNKVVMSAIK